MSKTYLLGVDVGGSKISSGLVLGDEVRGTSTHQTPGDEDIEVITAVLVKAIREVMIDDVKAIGIGMPGLVDSHAGVVNNIKNIPALSGFPLAEFLRTEFDRPVYLSNDANCYAVGEKYFGAGKPYENVVAFTLGTGLGAGIILDGYLFSGKMGAAGEFGSLKYLDKNLEYYCSAEFFKNKYDSNSLALASLARQGDRNAKAIFKEYGRHVGEAICFALSILDPELIILGGSIANTFQYFSEGMEETLENYPLKRVSDGVDVVVGSLSDSAILGAAALHYDIQNRSKNMVS